MPTGRALAALLVLSLALPLTAGCVSFGAPANRHPVAGFIASPTEINAGGSVHLDGSASTDPDGRIVRWSWTFEAGLTESGSVVDHTFNDPGAFTIDLVVTDDDGAKDRFNSTIHVNAWPVAVGRVAATPVKVLEEVTFDGSASRDPDGKIADYRWNFGDGATATGVKPKHAYVDTGTYQVNLTVTDDKGARVSSVFVVDVVLRKFKVTWEELHATLDTVNGHTDENASTIETVAVDATNITWVRFNLTWNDDIRAFGIGTPNDEFVLTVTNPRGETLVGFETTNQSIRLEFRVQPPPDALDYEARTSDEVLAKVLSAVAPSRKGNGDWEANVTIVNAGDFIDINQSVVNPDRGNNWTLEVLGVRYQAKITEVG